MMSDGLPENLPTGQLCDEARRRLERIEGLLLSRRNRDGAAVALTELWKCVETLAGRIGRPGAFDAGPRPRRWDDDLPGGSGRRERWDIGDGDPSLMPNDEGDWDEDRVDASEAWGLVGLSQVDEDARPISMMELCEGSGTDEEDEAATVAGALSVRDWRLMHFAELLRYLIRGAREVDDVSRRVLAMGRKVMPEQMRAFAGSKPSAAGVSRKAKRGGEKRATTINREQQEVERVMRDAGFMGYKGAGGAKSEAHRRNCSEAQKRSQGRNGSNRKRGHEARLKSRRQREQALGAETMPDPGKIEGRVIEGDRE